MRYIIYAIIIGIVALLLFPFLIIFMEMNLKAYSDSICSTNTYKLNTDGITLDTQQIEDLKNIYDIASSRHLDMNGAIIATETALVESNLENPSGGDSDSVGLFQQRKSQNWKGDLHDPKVQINNFYDKLNKISDWQFKDRWIVAQSIQRSAIPERYKEKDAQAVQLSTHVQSLGTQNNTTNISKCGGKTDSTDSGGVCLTFNNANLANCETAINNGLKQITKPTQNWHNRCLAFVAAMYGHPSSGYGTALEMWNHTQQHTDNNPPRGALVFWKTGSPAGHVALSLGGGKVITTDMRAIGEASIQMLEDFNTIWHAQYLGWTFPSFKG